MLPDGVSMEAMQKQAGHLWEFLDEMAARDPEEYAQFLKQQMESAGGAQRKPQVQETPTPGFCVRLRLRSQAPLYANVCAHSRVEAPSKTPDGSVPIAVGVPRAGSCTDGAGLAVDVVVGAEVTQRAARDARYCEEIAGLASQCVREVLGESRRLPEPLAPGYRVLTGISYAGTPQPFADCRQGPDEGAATSAATPGLEELSAIEKLVGSMGLGGKRPPTASGKAAHKAGYGEGGGEGSRGGGSGQGAPDAPGAFSMRLPGMPADNERPGTQCKASDGPTAPLVQEISSCEAIEEEPVHEVVQAADVLTLRVNLPRVATAADVDLEVGKASVSLRAEGIYSLRIALPVPVERDDASCHFAKKRRVLTVTLPISRAAHPR